MTRISYREALRDALREALLADPRVFLMGEDVGRYGGSYAVSKGLLAEFGEERIRDTPLSELGFVGAGIGAALGGMRPIVEVMTVNFSLLALDQIVNTAAALRHMSGGQFSVPLVIRMATGAGRQLAAQHSHSLENWYAHVPGIRVLAPATVEDARGMLRARAGRSRPGGDLRARAALQPRRASCRTTGNATSRTPPCAAPGPRGQPHHLRRQPAQDAAGGRSAGQRGHRCRGDRPARAAAAGHATRSLPRCARRTAP